jgi:hypothetical protein
MPIFVKMAVIAANTADRIAQKSHGVDVVMLNV